MNTKYQESIQREKTILNENGNPPPRFQNRLQGVAVKALAVFFALVIMFTFVSRASEGVTIARVTTDSVKSGVITNRLTLNGTLKPLEFMRLYLPGDLYIIETKVTSGQHVKKDDVLLLFDADDVAEKLQKMKDDLAIVQIRIDMAENSLAGSPDSMAVVNAQVALNQAYDDYNRLVEKHKEEKDDLAKKWDEAELARELAISEIPSGRDNGVTDARVRLELAKESYNDLVVSLDRELQSKESELNKAIALIESIESGELYSQADTNSILKAKEALEQAIADRDAALGKQNTTVERNREDLAKAEAALEEAKTDYDKAVEKTRKDLLDAGNDKLKAADTNIATVKEQTQSAVDLALAAYNAAMTKFNTSFDLGDLGEMERTQLKYEDALRKQEEKVREAEDARRRLNNELSADRTRTDFTDQPAVVSAQNAVESAERTVEQAKRSLEDAESGQSASYERAVENAERALKEAEENAQKSAVTAQESFDKQVMDSATQLKKAQRDVEAAERDLQKAVDTAGNATVTAKKAFEDADKTYTDSLRAAQRTIDTAQRSLENAKLQAEEGERTEERSQKQTEVDMIGYLSQKDSLEKSIKILEDIAELDGKLLSPVDGAIQTIASTGRTQDKIPVASISDNEQGFFFEARVSEKTAEDLALGASGLLTYTSEGKQQNVQASITGVGAVDENGQSLITGSLPAGSYPPGTSAELIITSTSERQYQTLPLSALRTDSAGTFVLALQENKTVTGAEFIAYRVPITVNMRDNERMSVSAPLGSNEMVIVGASKPVSEGDRVRFD